MIIHSIEIPGKTVILSAREEIYYNHLKLL